jgi:hypothetical protein
MFYSQIKIVLFLSTLSQTRFEILLSNGHSTANLAKTNFAIVASTRRRVCGAFRVDVVTPQTCQHSPIHVARTRQTRRHLPSRVAWTPQTRRHSPSRVAPTRQTRQHSPSHVARTRQTRRHLPSRVARTSQTCKHLPSHVARTHQTCRHSPKAIFEKNVTRLVNARVSQILCEWPFLELYPKQKILQLFYNSYLIYKLYM